MKALSLAVVSMIALLASAEATAQPQGGQVFAQVVIYDVRLEAQPEFERALQSSRQTYQGDAAFLNERVLRMLELDPESTRYVTYAKFKNPAAAENLLAQRLKAVETFVTRPPETHVARVTHSFSAGGETTSPKGSEFGLGRVNQIAQLGIFIPSPQQWQKFEKILVGVKQETRQLSPAGYIGEDLLVDTNAREPAKLAPHTPRPSAAAKASINYGEYTSMEAAENAYVLRHDPKNPGAKMAAVSRDFFSTLMVPNRFEFYRVIGNYGTEKAAEPQ